MTQREGSAAMTRTPTRRSASLPSPRTTTTTMAAAARVGIYTRISRDVEEQGSGVERQEELCRRLCENQGLEVVDVYSDNNISAYAGAPRPEYERLVADLASGRINHIVVWHIDRITRSVREFEDLVDLQTSVSTVQVGSLSLDNPANLAVARTLIAWGRYESEIKRARVLAKHLQKAQNGEWFGTACYGYTKDGKIVPEQAAIVRQLARRFLAGESLRSLVVWLTENDVPTFGKGTHKNRSSGEPTSWRVTTLRAMLASAKMSGQREHTPQPRAGARVKAYGFGQIVAQGQWEAILTPDQTAQIRAKLSDPNRRTSVMRKHLLSGGLIVCGNCGKPMNRRSGSNTRAGDKDRYQCIKIAGAKVGSRSDRCGSMSIIAAPTEELVCDYVQKALLHSIYDTHPEPTVGDDEREAARSELADISEARDFIAEEMSSGRMSIARYRAARDNLDARYEVAARVLEQPTTSVVRQITAGWDDIEAWWAQTDDEQKRAVIEALTHRIVIKPAAYRGCPTYDYSRVEIVWRQ